MCLLIALFQGFNIQVREGDFGALLFDREANVARGEGLTALSVGESFANGYVIDPEMEGVAPGLNRDGIRFACVFKLTGVCPNNREFH